MSRFTILIIFFVVIFGFSHAKSEDIQHDYTQQTCLAITTDDQSYSAAVEQIISIPIVNEWICQLNFQSRMALGGNTLDKTEFINGCCYWSISLYESTSFHLQFWNIFRVDLNSKNVFMMNDEGDYVLIFPPT